jgi:DNA-binding transcriptional LysR family regulator
MEIRQVRSFIEVARALSFHQAARRLHLSQPALSAQVKALEQHLGVSLLDRNRRGVRLTPAGTTFLPDAESLLATIHAMEQRVASAASGQTGHLRIGFVASATLEIVPAVALAFQKQYPGVTLELRNQPTVQQVEALRSGLLHAGFVRMPLIAPGLAVLPVHREPFVLVLPRRHPLARETRSILPRLAEEPFIAYRRSLAPAFYSVWTGICQHAGFLPRVVQETAEMTTALALVAAGMGVAIVPQGITRGYARVLAIKSLPRGSARSQIGLATPTGSESPLLRHLVATAQQVARRTRSTV